MKHWLFPVAALVLVSFLLAGCTDWGLDPHGKGYNFSYAVSEAGFNADDFKKQIDTALKQGNDPFARAELVFVLGRLNNDQAMLSFALDFFHKVEEQAEEADRPFEKALLYESIASLDDTKYNRLKAAEAWRRAGEKERALLNFNLAVGRETEWQSDTKPFENNAGISSAFSNVIIGSTRIALNSNDVVVSQADGVTRDFRAMQLQSPFSGNILDENAGMVLSELKAAAGFRHYIAAGTIVKEIDGKWYAPDEKGVYMFEVPFENVLYPTTRLLRKDIAVIIDTRGIGMIVSRAIAKNATAVLGSCDSAGDVKAALYLGGKGIKVICSTDLSAPMLIGSNITAAGSAPFRLEGDTAVIGDRRVAISRNEPVVAGDYAGKKENMLGYGTPAKYFSELEKRGVKLNVYPVGIDGMNQTGKIIRKAKDKKANVIAVRVLSSDDYAIVKAWLEEKSGRQAVLFGSETSPYGYKLSREFKSQTSFDDPNPVIE